MTTLADRSGSTPASAPTASPARKWLRDNITQGIAIAILAVVGLWVVFPSLFTAHDPIVGDGRKRFLPPSLENWFGTDFLGRDVYARVVFGTAHTLQGAAVAILIGLVVGALLGVVAASAPGPVEVVILRLVDVLLAIPGLLLALCIVATIGPSPTAVSIGIGISAIAPFARLTRSEALRVRTSEFVEAAHISGAGFWSSLFKHVLPNSAGPVLSLVAVEFGAAILSIAALGFLGYGTIPPTPEWGALVAEGRTYLATAWWLTTLPGVIVIVVVLAFNRVSRSLLTLGRL
ncbi:ABC transporter permease [Nocardia alba]|uniref:Peptide/nickel transport system permease protein n=1 Tax=Nocardia alba TaxID=225051 RepID=A0A4R1FPY0_9NOCA|nr:ABC transporter permease [Nocardia alba]TCJ95632.1 peptide/nickel transport system permease protein [Nocardia alba]